MAKPAQVKGWLDGWLNLLNVKLSPKRYWWGPRSQEVDKEGDPTLFCPHQNDSFTKMSSDESHFDVSLIVRGEVTGQCPQTTPFQEVGNLVFYTQSAIAVISGQTF